MKFSNVVMCETLYNNAYYGMFRSLTLPEIWKTQNRLEDSKSTSGGVLCIFGSHTFVPRSWMCKNQTSVLHSSTESEIISLDAGLRMDGIPARDLWDLVIEVLHPFSNEPKKSKENVPHVISGIMFSICSISSFSAQQAAPKRCRKECNKEQEKRELWQSRSRR